MHSVGIASTRTLSGNATSPWSVSGDTTAPSEIPTTTEMTRASGTGMCTGRPHSAAVATPSSEPVTRPAGKPSQFSVMPPSVATDSVSAARRHSRFGGIGGDAIVAINAAPEQCRQTLVWWLVRELRNRDTRQALVPGSLPQHDPDEVGGVLGAELFHDAGAMHFDRTRADPERTAGHLVGRASHDLREHLAFAWGQRTDVTRFRWPVSDGRSNFIQKLLGHALDAPRRGRKGRGVKIASVARKDQAIQKNLSAVSA